MSKDGQEESDHAWHKDSRSTPRSERERIRLVLLEEVEKGLADIKADRTIGLAEARAKYGRSVTSSTKSQTQ